MKHCNLCGRAVGAGEYQTVTRRRKPQSKGLTVCAHCLRSKPRCMVCQTPMSNRRGTLEICEECLREGLHCRACGARIHGEFLLLNGGDGPYCAKCYRTHAPCSVCGAPAGEGAVTLADGRVVCVRCSQTAIADPREAEALFERVIDLLGSALDLRLNIRPQLALVDRMRLLELARVAEYEDGHERGKVMGLFVRRGRKRYIYLQEGLPQILMIQIIAHEFAHAWQGENAPLLSDLKLREGFAEWVAYKMLHELGAVKKVAQMLHRRDVYGEGLRYWLAVENDQGRDAVLQMCKRA